MTQKHFEQFKGSSNYVISEALKNAVNVSIVLQRPLLVRGEPGTGKTLLAHSIASSLDKKLVRWNVKSTTKAAEDNESKDRCYGKLRAGKGRGERRFDAVSGEWAATD